MISTFNQIQETVKEIHPVYDYHWGAFMTETT